MIGDTLRRASGSEAVPPDFVAGTFGTARNLESLAINKPAGTAEGDLMLMHIINATPPAGWTVVPNLDLVRGDTLYKVAGPSEPSSYTITGPGFADGGATIVTYRDVNAVAPINASGGNDYSDNNQTSVVVAPSVTTDEPACRVVHFHSAQASTTTTVPSGSTLRVDCELQGFSRPTMQTTDFKRDAVGMTGGRSSTLGVTAYAAGHTIALAPKG